MEKRNWKKSRDRKPAPIEVKTRS